MLQIELEDSTHIKPDGHIRHEYRVTKVLKIQKRAREIPLPFDEAQQKKRATADDAVALSFMKVKNENYV